ncbi:hypothetical protein ES319_D01G222900v1 [Gossypium barbadense]|uniref:Uncharacterized protein n=2 Tax=Gossypium TaxID=3633 RepID=A0A5J5SVI4_GOSBA|nr:hypothetical protein ES319_D01G222900v1 [Gossypium barbadense]KAB2046284.1 hypothetical protein ES319_D01G222900v1 [Gossypium barbadense]
MTNTGGNTSIKYRVVLSILSHGGTDGESISQTPQGVFKPFKPLASYSSMLNQIEELLSARDYKAAMQLSENLRSLALKGLLYFQTF